MKLVRTATALGTVTLSAFGAATPAAAATAQVLISESAEGVLVADGTALRTVKPEAGPIKPEYRWTFTDIFGRNTSDPHEVVVRDSTGRCPFSITTICGA